VLRLAHHRSSSCGYWVQPRASLSADGRYAIFASDWGRELDCGSNGFLGRGDPYIIDLEQSDPPDNPPNAAQRVYLPFIVQSSSNAPIDEPTPTPSATPTPTSTTAARRVPPVIPRARANSDMTPYWRMGAPSLFRLLNDPSTTTSFSYGAMYAQGIDMHPRAAQRSGLPPFSRAYGR
jgi:hypothetical protein